MKLIHSPDVPPPAGHYSQGVASQGLVFVSGMLPALVAPGEPDSFERQVESAMQRCADVLAAAGCTLKDVLQCTAYIVGIDNWPRFNAVYAAHMGDHRPARAVVPVPELHHGVKVEIQMVARQPGAPG